MWSWEGILRLNWGGGRVCAYSETFNGTVDLVVNKEADIVIPAECHTGPRQESVFHPTLCGIA